MKFVLNPDAGSSELSISGEDYKYLIKVRRHRVGDTVCFRTKEKLSEEYRYHLERTDGKNAYFSLQSHHHAPCVNARKLHIGWCLIDPKTVEKTLPMLTELGVEKITFIHCHRSQQNFRLDYERMTRLMESSIMQCGRTSLIELGESPALSTFLKAHPDAVIFDFGGETLKSDENIETVVIGCEGGFDESERKQFSDYRVRLFSSPMILRSETAAVAIASRIL
ncbi:16S rRNA (uracil(1498)-N(3))-methyltransferase [Sulfuricurvum sp.]|uniref:16S rRNA (uracil(1498)-N(3))-methyltransferase n=1 Tax=Sulfuricurvum sp. TaxID=2025608 RepID=UPI00261AA503|nr:16S rRNA (uracil(1498)-N(3))-methyltransferase [Sulfuricurvum sp.]MDD2265858.1 16S rRNA (uracil(1498)-N(3))-methyltransferase [Sulfuricurvum sp.]MDD2784614.1 16S rRNA (uracil(1498)-N(3))-methyltransferase [Sulfuricurvum sp.]HZF71005.1 16S rRNA (uracil(1498)-N(3))-methyltransferase [Sulfuricurvum sp.]